MKIAEVIEGLKEQHENWDEMAQAERDDLLTDERDRLIEEGQEIEEDANPDEDKDNLENKDNETPADNQDVIDELEKLPPDQKVRLNNGNVVTVQDLIDGYMREDDYTKKMQEVGEVRRQLQLSIEQINQNRGNNPDKDKEIKENLENQKDEIDEALAELDPNDPQAKVLKGMKGNIDQLLNCVKNSKQEQEQAQIQEQNQQHIAHIKKLTLETMDSVSKDLNFPKFKSPDGKEEFDTHKDWQEAVVEELIKVNEKLTIPEFKELVRKVGRTVYQRQRQRLNAISAKYANSKRPPSRKRSGNDDQPKDTKGENLSLEERLSQAIDKRDNK